MRLFAGACLLLLCTVLIFSSCNKQYDPGTGAEPGGTRTMLDAIASIAPQPQVFTFGADTASVLTCSDGCRIAIPAYALQDETGATVTGSAELLAFRYLTNADMLFGGLPQISRTPIMQSSGALQLRFSQGGHTVTPKKGTRLLCYIPQHGNTSAGLSIWQGKRSNTAIDTNRVYWQKSDAAGDTVLYRNDTNLLFSTTNDWPNGPYPFINSLRPAVDTDSVTVRLLFDFPGQAVPSEMRLYALYAGNRCVVAYPLPEGLTDATIECTYRPVHFVAMAIVRGNFYGGITSATPQAGVSIPIGMKRREPAEFRMLVQALP